MSPRSRIEAPASFLDLIHLPGAQRVPRIIPVTSPAAGAEWSVNVPGGSAWYVQSITAAFVTSAAAGNRFPRLTYSDGSTRFARVVPTGAQAALNSYEYTWLADFGYLIDASAGVGRNMGLPAFPLLGGWSITTNTPNIDVGDQWSSIALYVIERRPPLDADLSRIPDFES